MFAQIGMTLTAIETLPPSDPQMTLLYSTRESGALLGCYDAGKKNPGFPSDVNRRTIKDVMVRRSPF
jgi:hypothetical protein